jgi:hypothetical protein
MTDAKLSKEEFDKLFAAYSRLAERLRETDRHGRGGTTLGEIFDSDAFVEGMIAVVSDPAYKRSQVKFMLEVWLGDKREEWSPGRGRLSDDVFMPCGIAMLGKTSRFGRVYPEASELGARAARHRSMTQEIAANRIADLRELAKLCGDLAEAFEKRLEEEGGIRRVQ